MDKGRREEAALLRRRFKNPLHPVIVLGLLRQYDDDITLLKTKLIFVVRLAVVEGPTSLVPVELRPLEIERGVIYLEGNC